MTQSEPLHRDAAIADDTRVRAVDDPPPVAPEAPDAADCCGGGCVSCVYDVHDAALERYEAALTAWRTRQAAARS